MEKLTKQDGQSMDLVADNIAKLKELFPEILTENKIDFNTLKELLGEELEEAEERYSFTWHGKAQARRLAQTPSTGTLRPCKEESVDWDSTQNLFIEGDNLEVLKLLQKSYHKQVKMIYIDPPYNTTEDFVYLDNYVDNIRNYLEQTGQVNDGKKLSSNTEISGRYHSKWLNMMYSRLRLARNLLRDDGLIFISIGDEEISQLRALCDEVFGQDNFEGHIHWRRRHNQPNDPTKMLGLVAEHVIVFAKDKVKYKASGVGKLELTGSFSNPDNDPRGEWASKPWKVGSDQSGSKYIIKSPTGVVFEEEWMGEESTYLSYLSDNRIVFTNNGNGLPRKKYFKFEREEEGQCATNWWPHEQFGHNQGASSDLADLMGVKNVFSNPKPTELIKGFISVSNSKKSDIILDFFAGSGTTAQSIWEHNISNQDNCRFVLVQLPEILNPEKTEQKIAAEFCANLKKPLKLSEVTKERLRRAKKRIKEENPNYQGDLGFKVFKLDSSNLKSWDANYNSIAQDLVEAANIIKADRKPEDVLFEILLKYGLDLTLPIDTHSIVGKTVYEVGAGALIVCLDDGVTEAVAEGIGRLKEELEPEVMRVVFKDSSFASDAAKVNAVQVLKQYGIEDVKAI